MPGLVIILVVVAGLLWAGQRGFIYFPERDVPPPASVGLPHADVVSFETQDGLTLEGSSCRLSRRRPATP